jgi:hypothetical protein
MFVTNNLKKLINSSNSSNRFPKPQRSITHLPDTGRGEFTPRESEVKTERTLVVKGPQTPR